jgi:hypothetical protein
MDPCQTASPVSSSSGPAERERPRTAGHIKEFGGGRECASSDCRTILSRYNRDPRCWVHEQLAKAAVHAP